MGKELWFSVTSTLSTILLFSHMILEWSSFVFIKYDLERLLSKEEQGSPGETVRQCQLINSHKLGCFTHLMQTYLMNSIPKTQHRDGILTRFILYTLPEPII